VHAPGAGRDGDPEREWSETMSIIISRDKNLLYPPFAEQLRYFERRLGAAEHRD